LNIFVFNSLVIITAQKWESY